ncbi:NAD(P)H-dependent oxidoreductase [Klebsiella sp. BIGb0407]|uniref:NAD(P)H-dependent oxidoreductase n=1 Tax=Klebsiella sp. BIGb0407 TaxID=2940603 RepID=UPI002169D484|nr:NAD(P)H-dependent oxidoreductase [Klebsiella sp. BIGb0407]MCS3429564.1 putative NADPH-quinone reductase [Klebsiella sp. BIGb0407]
MKNILIISGHPNLNKSLANATILDEVTRELPEVNIRRLDELYPAYQFDIHAEQQALLDADLIIWQFPFSWYSLPGMMKLWVDEVFTHGFAHGSTAKLAGKKLLLSFTTGAPEVAYTPAGFFGHNIEEYLPQFETTAALCNLEYTGAIYTHGVSYTGRDDEEKRSDQISSAREHAGRLIKIIRNISV